MRAGKGLDERLAEVRITFKKQTYNFLLPGEPNELVLRIQPEEGIYLKCINKRPGWSQDQIAPVHLNMNYKHTFPGSYVAGAYERMLLNAARGDQSLFVGSQELVEAWRVFTPLLDEIDDTKPQPVLYPFGSCFPEGLQDFARAHGVTVSSSSRAAVVLQSEAEGAAGPLSTPGVRGPVRGPEVTPEKKGGAGSQGPPTSEQKTKRGGQLAEDAAREDKQSCSAGARAGPAPPLTPPRKWRRLKSHGTF